MKVESSGASGGPAEGARRQVPAGSQGVQVGSNNRQVNVFVTAAGTPPAEASHAQFVADLFDLIEKVESSAINDGLPRFAPAGKSVLELTSAIRVRRGLPAELKAADSADSDLYALPMDRVTARNPMLEWREVAENENRVVVLGDPGMGKSWLTRWEAARLARTAKSVLAAEGNADDVLIPVLARCDELIAVAGSYPVADAVCRFIFDRYQFPDRSRERLRAHIGQGRIVLLLDALDELPDKQARRSFDELLGPWLARPSAGFRLTSRIAGYTGIPAPHGTFSEYELQPFAKADVSEFIAAWGLPEALAGRLREHVSGDAMANVARIPLLTALLCASVRDHEELPDNAFGVYERVLRRFLGQENRWPQSPGLESTDIDQLVGLLAPLAFHFAVRPGGWSDRMPASQIMSVIRTLGPVFTELGRDAASVLRDLSVRAGILVPSAVPGEGRNPPYLFLHRSVAEYLVACHIGSLPRSEWQEILRRHLWFDPHWRPVIHMLGAAFVQQQRPEEAVALLSELLNQAEDPFDQALQAAARVATQLPAHEFLPANIAGPLAQRLAALVGRSTGWDATCEFLRAHLARLPGQVTDELMSRLEDLPDEILARILSASRDQRVTARLISLLDREDVPAAHVFAALREQESPEFIAEMLRRFDDPLHHYPAVMVLKTYTTAPSVLAEMLRRTRDSDPMRRFGAVQVLRHRSEPELSGLWLQLARDDDQVIQVIALDALGERWSQDFTEIFRVLMDSPNHLISDRAARIVINSGSVTLAEIIELARHSNAHVRCRAAEALASYPDAPEALIALRDLAADAVQFVRWSAAEALASQPRDEAAAILVSLLDDESVASKAAESLRLHDRPSVADMLAQWLGAAPDPERFAIAARALTGIKSPGVTPLLLSYAAHLNDSVRLATVSALAGRGEDAVVEALCELMHDASPAIRRAAVTSLQPLAGDARAISALLGALADKDARVRASAAVSLEISDDHPNVLPALLPLLADESEDVREAVAWKIGDAPTPATLHSLCDWLTSIARHAFTIPRAPIEQLAERVYRGIPATEQPRVLHVLAEPSFTPPARGDGWLAPGIGRYVSPDLVMEEYFDVQIVVLLQGNNLFGNRVYSYVLLSGMELSRMFFSMQRGDNFRPAEFGYTLFAGLGEPPPDLVALNAEMFNMTEVPMPGFPAAAES